VRFGSCLLHRLSCCYVAGGRETVFENTGGLPDFPGSALAIWAADFDGAVHRYAFSLTPRTRHFSITASRCNTLPSAALTLLRHSALSHSCNASGRRDQALAWRHDVSKRRPGQTVANQQAGEQRMEAPDGTSRHFRAAAWQRRSQYYSSCLQRGRGTGNGGGSKAPALCCAGDDNAWRLGVGGNGVPATARRRHFYEHRGNVSRRGAMRRICAERG